MAISVGYLTAVLNVCLLFIIVLAERIIESVIRIYTLSRLRTQRKAPIVHDRDVWLPNIPRSLIRFYRYPGLVITDFYSDLGVTITDRCNPQRRIGPVISVSEAKMPIPDVKQGATAFHLQRTLFLDGPLTSVVSRFPVWISSEVCLRCLDNSEMSQVLGGCNVRSGHPFEPGSMAVRVRSTGGTFRDVAVGFQYIAKLPRDEHLRIYSGSGDVTDACDIFVLQTTGNLSTSDIYYFEYENLEHCRSEIKNRLNETNESGEVSWIVTKALVHTKIISCKRNSLIGERYLEKALQIYRSVQLEDYHVMEEGNDDGTGALPMSNNVPALTEDDVYRSVLSRKLLERHTEEGEYFVYTSCGAYQWRFLAPFISVCALLLVLSIVAVLLRANGIGRRNGLEIPSTSQSWLKEVMHARKARHDEENNNRNNETGDNEGCGSGICTKIFRNLKPELEELIFVDGDDGQAKVEISAGSEHQ